MQTYIIINKTKYGTFQIIIPIQKSGSEKVAEYLKDYIVENILKQNKQGINQWKIQT